ncbi:MAG TPA: GNAT family N-acetyltransferase [Rhabdochlamydiaceae bacterium]|jgi:putative acetyltransferase|nr:GNAT family N-acetyltransferase [Rhabdochlamydiaceae bacterium]
MKIRPAKPEDGPQIGELIYETVRTINRRDYSEEQVQAWAPDKVLFSTYEGYGYVAELEGRILGFANLTPAGYLHRLYVHKDFQGQGIASRLLKAVELKARELRLQEITTESSITAKPFFLAHDFLTQSEQTKVLRGVSFINFKMHKKNS